MGQSAPYNTFLSFFGVGAIFYVGVRGTTNSAPTPDSESVHYETGPALSEMVVLEVDCIIPS